MLDPHDVISFYWWFNTDILLKDLLNFAECFHFINVNYAAFTYSKNLISEENFRNIPRIITFSVLYILVIFHAL